MPVTCTLLDEHGINSKIRCVCCSSFCKREGPLFSDQQRVERSLPVLRCRGAVRKKRHRAPSWKAGRRPTECSTISWCRKSSGYPRLKSSRYAAPTQGASPDETKQGRSEAPSAHRVTSTASYRSREVVTPKPVGADHLFFPVELAGARGYPAL